MKIKALMKCLIGYQIYEDETKFKSPNAGYAALKVFASGDIKLHGP